MATTETNEIASEPQELDNYIDELPDEVLEFILSMLPPYQDLHACMCVCRRWYNCSKTVMRKTSNKLVKAISEFKIQWRNITPVDMAPTITKRFSHAACVHENSMYIFGGCTTNSTAFNDLWRFDLSKRQWIRPLAMGTYPVPKAYTSMARYKDNLVLFGGWTYPSQSAYYQSMTMYNEIHFYNVTANRWILVSATNSPPQVAGHSATVIGDKMIVFGGLNCRDSQSDILCSNDVWVLDLVKMSWHKQETSEPRPSARYNQSLVLLDEENVMILGGVQTFSNRFMYNDCWTLCMKGPVWKWREMSVKNKEWAAANIWCNPACRVGDKVVSLSRCRNGRWNGAKPLVTSAVRITTVSQPPAQIADRVERCARKPFDRDHNINGRRGIFPQRQNAAHQRDESGGGGGEGAPRAGPSRESEEDSDDAEFRVPSAARSPLLHVRLARQRQEHPPLSKDAARQKVLKQPNSIKIVRQLQEANKFRMAAFACDTNTYSTPPENDLINQRHIAHLARRPDVEPEENNDPAPQPAVKKQKRNTLTMHVLDIASVLNGKENSVSWLCPRQGDVSGAPEEYVMYSLVRGNGELIMFGGVHNDVHNSHNLSRPSVPRQNLYSNSLHFITPPRDVI